MSARVAMAGILAVLAASAVVTACERKDKTIYRPLPGSGIVLDVDYMGGKDAACGTPGAWILRLDTSTNPVGTSTDWDRVYLFDDELNLYGCGSAATGCSDTDSAQPAFTSLTRVMLEGLTVSAASYDAGSADVACRAVADGLLPATPVEIELEQFDVPTPLPNPGATPVIYPEREWTVHLKVLRVGGPIAIPVPVGHQRLRYVAAASFSSTPRGIGLAADTAYGEAGRIAWRGGWDISTINTLSVDLWEFDPHSFAVTESPAGFVTGLFGISATTTTSDGRPGILFAGGLDSSGVPSNLGWSYRADQSISQRTLPTSRGFHGAAPFRGASGEAIALVGGIGMFLAADATNETMNGAYENGSWTGFFPFGTSLPAGWTMGDCLGSPQTPTTMDRFCTPGGFGLASGAGAMASVQTATGEAFFVGGFRQTAPGPDTSDRTRLLTPTMFVEPQNVSPKRAMPVAAVMTSTGIPAFDETVLVVGGETISGVSLSTAQLFQPTGGTPIGVGHLLVPRARAAGVTLRDRTVLITGGRTAAAPSIKLTESLERFVPAAPPANSVLQPILPAGDPDGSCTIGKAGECVSLLGARYGHAAVRLEETSRWYDGAVLLIGGTVDVASPIVELFVPAYDCGRVLEPLSNPTLFVPCDRGRAPETITDPRQP